MPIEAILIDRVANALSEIRFQFDGGNPNAVQEQDRIETVFVVLSIAYMLEDSQPIGIITCEDIGIHRVDRFERSHFQFFAKPEHIEAVAASV